MLGYPWSGGRVWRRPWRAKFHRYKILERDPLCTFNLLPHLTIVTALMKFRFYKRVAHLAENPLIQLVNYEVIILMDDSISMGGTRWKQVWDMFLSTVTGVCADFFVYQAKKVMKKVVKEAAKYDQDGIEIEFLNSEVKSKHTKVRPRYRELLRLWPDFGARRRRKLKICSRMSNRRGQLHLVPV